MEVDSLPKKRTNEMFIKEVKDIVGTEFTPLSSYEGSNIKVKMFHSNCGNEIEIRPKDFLFKGVRCSICAGNKPPSINQVKMFVESQSKCKLLSDSYRNQNSVLKLECECGTIFETKFIYFKHENKRYCNACGRKRGNLKTRLEYENVRKQIENQGHKLISKTYVNNSTPLSLVCPNGHEYLQSYNDFQGGHYCKKCSFEKQGLKYRLDFHTVKRNIEINGYLLISPSYENSKRKLKIKCPNGHDLSLSYDEFHHSGHRCNKCHLNIIKDDLIYPTSRYLRDYTIDWKMRSMKECDFKCVLTGGNFDAVHHLHSFHLIVKETFKNVGITFKPDISGYKDEEIQLIVAELLRLHDFYGNGVCLRKDVHKLYHSIYGYVNNVEQFEEFKNRWMNGEFKEVI